MNKRIYAQVSMFVLAVFLCGCANNVVLPQKYSKDSVINAEDTQEPQQFEENKKISDIEPISNSDHIQIINDTLCNVSGKCQWAFRVYPEGEINMSQSEPVPSASVIKVFIMEYAFTLVQNGELRMDDVIGGQSVKDLIYNMITVSDNYATNKLIDHFGMEKLNGFFADRGYIDTQLQRRMLDNVARSSGKENYTSVKDVMKFLDMLYCGRKTSPCKEMIDIMKNQQVKTKIRNKFDSGVEIANKTGELDNVENDIGIIFGEKGDLAVVFLCSSLSDTGTARQAISTISYELADKLVFEQNEK